MPTNTTNMHGFIAAQTGKSNLKDGSFLYTTEDMADYELKACCEAWYFDHKTVVRHPGRNQLPYGGMPLLSLKGFTDMMAVESAGEPERSWRGLNAALRHYGIWPAMGPLPREVFLQVSQLLSHILTGAISRISGGRTADDACKVWLSVTRPNESTL